MTYPAGTWLLPADQPYRAHLKDLMERQVYPNRLKADGTAEAPVRRRRVDLAAPDGRAPCRWYTPYAGDFERVTSVKPPTGRIVGASNPSSYTLADTANDDFTVVNALLAAGVAVARLAAPPTSGRATLAAGTWLIKAEPQSGRRSRRSWSGPRRSRRAAPACRGPAARDQAPRLGVYQPWAPSMDEGWTRLVLEQFEFPYTTLHDAEVRAGHLGERFDALILPSVSVRALRDGQRPERDRAGLRRRPRPAGIDAIREFVRAGGTLICLEDSCQFAIEAFGLPVKNVLKDLKTSEFYAPGSVLRARRSGPIMDVRQWHCSPATRRRDAARVLGSTLIARWRSRLAQESRGLEIRRASRQLREPRPAGERLAARRREVARQGRGGRWSQSDRGRVVLFGFPPQHRGQPHGTFRLLFNAIRLATRGRSPTSRQIS